MPELPEVETVRRHLARCVPGRVVRSVWTSGHRLRKPLPRGFGASFAGGRFTGVRRIGKFLYLDWESRDGRGDRSLLAHLGMTGSFLHQEAQPGRRPPHTHAAWKFADGSCLLYCDVRRFGLLEWVARDSRPANLGPDAVEVPPSGEWLRAQFGRSRVPVKSALMDQRKLAGLGNIYASEALFRAGISPRRAARTLSVVEAERLALAIRDSLAEAVRRRGTTIANFRDPDDRPGAYGPSLAVYGRAGEPCPRCATAVRRIVQSGRSTFYCPGCQKRAAAASATPPATGTAAIKGPASGRSPACRRRTAAPGATPRPGSRASRVPPRSALRPPGPGR